MWYTQLVPGNHYIVETQEKFGLPTCDRCTKPGAGSFFDVCITHLPNGTLQPLTPCFESCGNNMFINGYFEDGNTGFYVDPAVTYHNCSSIPGPFYYGICTNANNLTSNWQEPAHNGLAYYVDDGVTSSNQADVILWSENVQVLQNEDYCLSFWFANIDPADGDAGHAPHIIIDLWGNNTIVQHIDLGTISDVAGTSPNPWIHMSFVWSSGINTSVSVDVRSFDNGNGGSGNDIGMDDFEMSGRAPAGPPISASQANPVCSGQSVTLSVPLTQYETVVWQPGNYTTSSITILPTATTTYTATITDACNVYTSTYTLQLIPFYPGFSFAPTTICVQTPVNFTNQTATSLTTTYLWNFGDNTTSNLTSPSHTYSSPGNYTVTLTATNSCGTIPISQVVHVIPSTSTYNANCCSASQTYTYDETTGGPIFIGNPLSNPLHWTPSNGTIYVRGTVTIVSGAALVIDPGTVVEFDPLSKIVVQRGALLTVNGATLKGLTTCGTMWQGIEVWGDKTKNETQIQNPSTGQLYQGKAVLTNATMRDAHNGVVSGRSVTNYYDPNYGGGIILATNTSFLNCGYSVRLTPYPNYVSYSRIISCSFNSTTLLDPGYSAFNSYTYPNANNQLYAYANATQRAYCFVQAFGVKFALIADNTFNNAEYGIIGVNSSLRVIDWDGDLTGNVFTNITSGEVHGNIFNSPFYANRIEKNQFTSTIIPIQSWNGLGDRINSNRIPNGALIGIGSVSSQAITINDNIIGGSTGGCLIGVSASNTGAMGGLIGFTASGNIFTKCITGTATGGINPFLQIHCNVYDNPVANQYNQNWSIGGTSLANQGVFPAFTEKDPAGNFFQYYTPIRNQISSPLVFDYYSHSTTSFSLPQTVIPTAVGSPVVIPTGSNMTSFANACTPGPPCTNCNPQMLSLDQQISDLENEKQLIEASLDGGQTQVLLDAITSNMSSGQLKDLLLANSPLSDEVLLAYVARNGTSPGLFKDVIVPNSPVSSVVRPSLYSKITAMPNGIRNEIDAAQYSSNRTLYVVNAELQSKIGQRQQLFNQQMLWYIDRSETDTLVGDSVYILLERQQTFAATAALGSSYLADEKYVEALTTINSLEATTPEEQSEKEMLILLHGIYSSGRNVFQMTSPEEQQVRSAAALPDDCPARANARVILFIVFGEPLVIDVNSNNRLGQTDTVSNNTGNFLGESYPNPAAAQVNMQCHISTGTTAVLNVFDVNGKLVYSRLVNDQERLLNIQTSEWSSGVYLAILETEKEVIGQQKFAVENPE